MFPYTMQGKNIVIVVDNKPHTITTGHLKYAKIVQAIKDGDESAVRMLVDPKKTLVNYGQGKVYVQGDRIFWGDRELRKELANRLVSMIEQEFPVEPIVLFVEKLMQNPSHTAVEETYIFAEHNNLPITSDGCLLAYKRIRENYRDCHSDTVLNKPASLMTPEDLEYIKTTQKGVTVTIENGVTVVTMDRNAVCDDRRKPCEAGLHFCSLEYLNHFEAGRTIIVKVNPRDIVSIPNDYNNSKARACRYEIVSELGVPPEEAFNAPVQDEPAQAAAESAE